MVIEHAELERAGLAGGGCVTFDGVVLALAAWLALVGEAAWTGTCWEDVPELVE